MLQKKRICIIVLLALVCILGTALPAASTPAATEDAPEHYVLLLDISAEELRPFCRSALNMILDTLPPEGARVGVIAYGTSSGNAYAYSAAYAQLVADTKGESRLVRILAPMGVYGASADGSAPLSREELLASFDRLSSNAAFSPHEAGLLAAVDMLQQAGTGNGKGQVILISDGLRSSDCWEAMCACRDKAIGVAQENNWPIWTVRLDLSSKDKEYPIEPSLEAYEALDPDELRNDIGFPTVFMNEVAFRTGALQIRRDGSVERPGTWLIEGKPEDTEALTLPLYDALQQILVGNSTDHKLDSSGWYDERLTVTPLTCEELVFFSGSELDAIRIRGEESGYDEIFTDSGSDGFVSVERGDRYFRVRLLRPQPGDYQISVQGQAGSTVYVSKDAVFSPLMEVTVHQGKGAVAPGADGSYQVDVSESLEIRADFSYQGEPLQIDDHGFTVRLDIRSPDRQYQLLSCEMSERGSRVGSDSFTIEDLYQDKSPQAETCIARVIVTDTAGMTIAEESFPLAFDFAYAEIENDTYKAAVNAFENIEIVLADHIRYANDRSLTFELSGNMPNGDLYTLLDGGEEVKVIEGTPGTITIKGIDYLGTHKPSLKISDKNVDIGTIGLELEVLPVPVSADHESLTLYDRDLFGHRQTDQIRLTGEIATIEQILTEPEGIVDCTWNDSDSHIVKFSGLRVGECEVTLLVTERVRTLDQDRQTVNVTTPITIRVNVASAWGSFGTIIAWILALVALFILALCMGFDFYKRSCMIPVGWDLTLDLPNCGRIAREGWWIHVDGRDKPIKFDTVLEQLHDAEQKGPYLDHDQDQALTALMESLEAEETGIRFGGVFGKAQLLRIVEVPGEDSCWKLSVNGQPCGKDTIVRRSVKPPEIRITKNETEFTFTMRPREM